MCVRVCIYLYTYKVTYTTSAPKNHLLIWWRFYSRKGSGLCTILEQVDDRDCKALSHRSVVFHLRSEELCGLAKALREWGWGVRIKRRKGNSLTGVFSLPRSLALDQVLLPFMYLNTSNVKFGWWFLRLEKNLKVIVIKQESVTCGPQAKCVVCVRFVLV